MQQLRRLKALRAFEATARLGSYAAASIELGVTPAAVGQLVRGLEDGLGVVLFDRAAHGRQRLSMTPAAAMVATSVTHGFQLLASAEDTLIGSLRQKAVRLTASHAVIASHAMPDLGHFVQDVPDIDVRLDVTDQRLNLARGEADLAIRCGPGGWAGVQAERLQSETMVVVCAPSLLPENCDADHGWLIRQTLIDDQTPQTLGRLPDWGTWFAAAGMPPPTHLPRLAINAPSAILTAVQRGQGVALMRRLLTVPLQRTGRLVQPLPGTECKTEWCYYLVATPAALARSEVRTLHDWLLRHWPRETSETAAGP